MTRDERTYALWAGLFGAVLGYLFFVSGEASPGGVVAALLFTVAAAAVGYYLARGQRARR